MHLNHRTLTKGDSSHTQYHHLPDHQLWTFLLEGDDMAMGELYERYFSPLYHYGLKVSRRPGLSEDSIQDLFFKIWNKRDSLSPTSSTRSYLFMAYRRILMDKVSGLKRFTSEPQQEMEPVISMEETIIRNEMDSEQLKLVRSSIESLPSRQKEILYLRFYKGLDYREISEIMNISYQSVRNSMHRSLTCLRRVFVISSSLLFVINC